MQRKYLLEMECELFFLDFFFLPTVLIGQHNYGRRGRALVWRLC